MEDIAAMNSNKETGQTGEDLAANYLQKNGFKILNKNWRWGSREIDIIASKNQYIHFIEVKTRTGKKYGYPDDAVSKMKIRFMMDAAEEYLFRNPGWKRIQFDILAIELGGKEIVYTYIEDVYAW